MNSIDAMKDVDGRASLPSHRTRQNEHLLVSVSDTGVGLPPQQRIQISMRSLRRSVREPAWDSPSAARSLNRMAAAVGRRELVTRREFHLTLPTVEAHE